MFQRFNNDLPPMPTQIRKLRSELVNAEGIHLVYNVPRNDLGAERIGPMVPFPGLCMATLIYRRTEKIGFHIKIGNNNEYHIVGWTEDKAFGMFSLTWTGTEFKGKKDLTVKTLKERYVYAYIYVDSTDTIHGWVNNTYDLKDDTPERLPVMKYGKKIVFAQNHFQNMVFLEIHWVAWGSSHNQMGGPLSTVVDQLFPKTDLGMINFKEADIFEMRTGTVVTVRTKYENNPNSNQIGVIIGIGCATCVNKDFNRLVLPECSDPNKVYTFRVTFTEKGALVHQNEGDVSYVGMPSYETHHGKCRAFLILDNVKPVQIQVETMGQTWL